MQVKKRKNDFLIIILLVVVAFSATPTLAKFFASSTASTQDIEIANWSVVLNTEDITRKNTLSEDLNITLFQNGNTAQNQISPGMEGFFDITIDTSDAEVAAMYTIQMDTAYIETIGGFDVVGYQKDDEIPNGTMSAIPAQVHSVTSGKILGKLLLHENKGKIVKLRIYIRWKDEISLNESQTDIGANVSSIEIPINITVEQYQGEEIIEDPIINS